MSQRNIRRQIKKLSPDLQEKLNELLVKQEESRKVDFSVVLEGFEFHHYDYYVLFTTLGVDHLMGIKVMIPDTSISPEQQFELAQSRITKELKKKYMLFKLKAFTDTLTYTADNDKLTLWIGEHPIVELFEDPDACDGVDFNLLLKFTKSYEAIAKDQINQRLDLVFNFLEENPNDTFDHAITHLQTVTRQCVDGKFTSELYQK